MSKDDIVGNVAPLPAPDLVVRHRNLYYDFTLRCHQLAMMIMDRLDEQLHLPIGTLSSRHRIHELSGDQTRLLRMIPQPVTDRRTSMVAHTDLGSITVLFNVLGGLQILPPGGGKEEKDWRYIEPQHNCAIINIGDALSIFTNNVLRSNIHRVTYAPGEQATLTRYSLAYFARPENAAKLERLEGSDEIPPLAEGVEKLNLTAGEWVERRQMAQIQDTHKAKSKDSEPVWATVGIEDSEKIKGSL
jgi:isopenicillin N synthase-like dioxygenase